MPKLYVSIICLNGNLPDKRQGIMNYIVMSVKYFTNTLHASLFIKPSEGSEKTQCDRIISMIRVNWLKKYFESTCILLRLSKWKFQNRQKTRARNTVYMYMIKSVREFYPAPNGIKLCFSHNLQSYRTSSENWNMTQ